MSEESVLVSGAKSAASAFVSGQPVIAVAAAKAAHQERSTARHNAQKSSKLTLGQMAAIRASCKRANDLASLVVLENSNYHSIFDFAPLDAYSFYIRNYGEDKFAQGCTQTGDESLSKDSQTEDWDIVNRWTEAPPNQFQEAGADVCQLPWIPTKALRKHAKPIKDVDQQRYAAFVSKAFRVVNILLDESLALSNDSDIKSLCPADDFVMVDSRQFHIPEMAKGSPRIHEVSSEKLLILSWAVDQSFHPSFLLHQTLIALYRPLEVYPFRILICYPLLNNIVAIASKAGLCIAGASKDSSIQLWNVDGYNPDSVLRISEKLQLYRPDYMTDTKETKTLNAPQFRLYVKGNGTERLIAITETGAVQTWVLLCLN